MTAHYVGAWEQPKARPEFEVASIKPNDSGLPKVYVNPFTYSPSGQFTATNVTLMDIIISVYQTSRIQVRGGSDWINSERFDIIAKADTTGGAVTEEQRNLMIQALLEDRFRLALHRETKPMPVYVLVSGKNPPTLRKAKEGEETTFTPGERGKMTFQRMSIGGLVDYLSNALGEPVVDGTGVKGFFDFTLDPMKILMTRSNTVLGVRSSPLVGSNRMAPNAADSGNDLVLSAVREQLGLKFEKRKEPLEITVIDHAERPRKN